jgi:hypothetical protein
LWNANGLTQQAEELKSFLSLHNIGALLISETHFTDKSYLNLPNYTGYHTNHPAGTAILKKKLHQTASIERLLL